MPRLLPEMIRGYLIARAQGNEQNYVVELRDEMERLAREGSPDEKMDVVQQLIFLNLRGHDTTWADFLALEVMSQDSYGAKRIAYTAAEQMWTSQSDVVLMATNRVQKDLTSVQPLLSSLVLAAMPSFLSLNLAHDVASDVISLMSAARPVVRQKAIMTFYHICLRYTDALRPGFIPLRARLDDQDTSVVFSALTVMSELCAHNVNNFIGLIPKFHKMLETSSSNWVTLRLIYLLRMLSGVEPRLPKKLIGPFTTILETTSSVTVLFECVRTIIEIPITNSILLTYATQRMQAFLEHEDTNLRFLCLSLFIKLIEIQPRLVAQHRELITQCLDSNDEATRLLALDLLAALANEKTIDGIVARMYDHFKQSKSVSFKNQLLKRVIEICSKNDYDLVNDFEWYISVLMDFVIEGGFDCYDVLAEQLLDLALRVPDTRERLVAEMGGLFENIEYKDATPLLLAASHIIGEYATDSEQFEHLMQPLVVNTDERVQESVINTAFRLYLRSESEKMEELEGMFPAKLSIFESSLHAEVQDCASLTNMIVKTLKKSHDGPAMSQFQEMLVNEIQEDFEPIERPAELDEPIEIFLEEENESAEPDAVVATHDVEVDLSGKPKVHGQRPMKVRRQKANAQKPKVIKLGPEKPVVQPKPKTQPGVLCADLANVILTDTIADEEMANLPRPMPYVQQELMKNQQNNSRSGRHRRHRRGESSAPAAAPPKPPPTNPVTGPKPRSRVQPLGENSCMLVSATEFFCRQESPNVLEIELSIQNQSMSPLTAIDISVQAPPTVAKPVSIPSYSQEIKPGEIASHRISIEVMNIVIPQKLRLFLIPTDSGMETLESQFRVFPSYFLLPGDEAGFEEAQQRAVNVEKRKPTTTAKPKEVLQCIVNVLRAAVMKSTDVQSRSLYARSTLNDEVICNLKIEVGALFIELRSTSLPLVKVLIREVEMKLQSLSG